MTLDQRLGGRADDLQVTEIEEKHIRRRIEQPHCPVSFERRQVMRARKPHRQDNLIDLALRDVVLAARDGGLELVLRGTGSEYPPLRAGTGNGPRSSRMTSARNAARSDSEPECSSAMRRVR